MSTKKKSDLSNSLDDLRHEDPKKRLSAVIDLKQIAAAIGPTRVRNELLAFLAEFIDDQQKIVLELLSQLENFTSLLGGLQYQKLLIPLLVSFCKTDEKKPAVKATAILQKILAANKDLAMDTIKKLMKTDMNIAKQSAAQLIAVLLPELSNLQSGIIELYTSLLSTDSPKSKIIASKYLQDVLRSLKSKQQVGKWLECIYTEGDDLAKIYAIKALVDYYDVSSNFCLTKFKNLTILNSWRINIKICDCIDYISSKIAKAHFKLIFEPSLLKFMASAQSELRASSCKTLAVLAKNMSEDEIKLKLIPYIKKLATDSIDYVKVQLAKNITALCAIVGPKITNDQILPVIFDFIKDPISEISFEVAKKFNQISTQVNRQMLEQNIITPLLHQLRTDDWRLRCRILEILRGFLVSETYLTEKVLKVLFSLTDDKIDAVRLKMNQFIIEIMTKNSKEWCQKNVIPLIVSMKQNSNYIKRQNLLEIIDKTTPNVSDKILKEVYQKFIASFLADQVANVRYKTVQILNTHSQLNGLAAQKQLQKLKEDKDKDVRDMVKKLRA